MAASSSSSVSWRMKTLSSAMRTAPATGARASRRTALGEAACEAGSVVGSYGRST